MTCAFIDPNQLADIFDELVLPQPVRQTWAPGSRHSARAANFLTLACHAIAVARAYSAGTHGGRPSSSGLVEPHPPEAGTPGGLPSRRLDATLCKSMYSSLLAGGRDVARVGVPQVATSRPD